MIPSSNFTVETTAMYFAKFFKKNITTINKLIFIKLDKIPLGEIIKLETVSKKEVLRFSKVPSETGTALCSSVPKIILSTGRIKAMERALKAEKITFISIANAINPVKGFIKWNVCL
jgi:hypothetical protein